VTDGDDSYGEGNLSLGRSIVPLEIPLDRSVVAQAQAHLREQSPEHRARWHRQIEVVLHRFARRQGYRRRAVHVSAGRTQIWWMPPKSPGLPPTDIQFLRSPALHAFSGYQSLSRAISDQAGLAQLVIASLLVRRDYRLRDFASIQEARAIFDGMAPSLVRVAHRYVREPEHIRALEGLLTASRAEAQAVKTQADTRRAEMEAIRAQAGARQVSTSRAGAEASRAQAYHEHGLTRPIDRLLSEASIGKAYLQEMGIQPFMYCEPLFPREGFGAILCAYYGGRAEVRIRREIREVLYCDFKSMYPTVNSLMGLWAFVIGQGMTATDSTSETQAFLDQVTLEDMQARSTWRQLPTLVRLSPQEDTLPVRTKYDGQTYTIGLTRHTSPKPLWYTLADCIVSKLLTGRCPRIGKAITYRPGPPQKGLKPTKILGLEEFTIDPTTGDFFSKLVDLRDHAKANGNSAEKALKIIANSTSYGIFIEVIRDDAPKAEPVAVFGPNGEQLKIATKAVEEPGRYFHPLLGVLITGAARLMLGIAEKLTLDRGLDWAFCDTDSLAIARPKGTSRREFHRRASEVIDWFAPLNPYTKSGSILKVEDHNYTVGSKKMQPLYCWAISAKRYALFNRAGNKIILRKASAHGLGHLLDPYPESQAPADIPLPAVPLKEIGVSVGSTISGTKSSRPPSMGTPTVCR
jgi:hypothetical protein